MISLVIFDCDGVLVDSERIGNQVLADHACAFGVPMSLQESMNQFVGLSMNSVVEKLGQMAGRQPPLDFLDKIQAETFARFQSQLQAVPGVVQSLNLIESMGLKTCVASSGGHDKLAVTLGLTGLKGRFEGRVYSASEVARGKPAPDLFLYAAWKMDVDPAYAIVVEDSRPGVEAAVAAGMTVFGYAPDSDGKHLSALGARPFHHMNDLPPLISALI